MCNVEKNEKKQERQKLVPKSAAGVLTIFRMHRPLTVFCDKNLSQPTKEQRKLFPVVQFSSGRLFVLFGDLIHVHFKNVDIDLKKLLCLFCEAL